MQGSLIHCSLLQWTNFGFHYLDVTAAVEVAVGFCYVEDNLMIYLGYYDAAKTIIFLDMILIN